MSLQVSESRESRPRAAAKAIVQRLVDAGHVAYFAGGCVRDALLGIEPKDFDVATDAEPARVKALFPNAQFVGEAFGVALVRTMGIAVEVATFRSESGYSDGRRPDQVTFTDARTDATRRDFTVNGLFEDPLTTDPNSRIIDFVQGREDLQKGVIRAIGDPFERFAEDYLRMLRAVRFAARLGFALDPATAAAARQQARYLGQISRERIGIEVLAMLTGPRPAVAVELLSQLWLDGPALNEDHAAPPLLFVAGLPAAVDAPIALSAWLLDRHLASLSTSPGNSARALHIAIDTLCNQQLHKLVTRWRKALAMSNENRDDSITLINLLSIALAWESLPIAKRKRLLAHRLWHATATLLACGSSNESLAQLAALIRSESAPLFEQGVAPLPLISGDDLIALGLQPGPAFKGLLDRLYDEQLEGHITTRQQAIELLQSLK
jgi:poly(A) polymerase